jgi:predicted neuraminidase
MWKAVVNLLSLLTLASLSIVGGEAAPESAAAAPHGAGKGTMRTRRVFGPEIRTGTYKHPAALTELRNGDLYLVYYGGAGEYAVNTGVFGARLRKGSTRWTTPRLIAHDPFRSLGNAVVWQAPDEVVWLFYVVRWGDTWSTSRIQGKVSRDGAKSWSDSFVVSDVEGMMVRGRPIVLSDGAYLLPVYHETGHDTEAVGADSTSRFLRFDPKARPPLAWKPSGVIRSAKGNIQPAVVELSPGRLTAYCRRGGDYESTTKGYIVRSVSRDGGKTWEKGLDSKFPNPNAAIELLKLRNGHLLLFYNDSMTERTPLTVALSTDGDKSWPRKRNLATGPFDYAYPYAIQAGDGRVHLVYTSHERTVINHAVFDEKWVLGAY